LKELFKKIFILIDRCNINFHSDRGSEYMLSSKEMEDMGRAIEQIGAAKACITGPIIKETKRIVLENGLDAAELYASQLAGTDENIELLRIIKIFRKNNLSKKAIAQVLDNIDVIESGKW